MKRLIPLIFACTSAQPTLGDYQRATVTALCRYYSHCGAFSASQEATCERALAAQVDAAKVVYSVDEALAAGRLAFDPAAAQACTATVAAAHCDTKTRLALGEVAINANTGAPILLDPYTLTNAPCAGVLKGTVAAGGSCKADRECAGGWCDNHDVPGCAGTCTPFSTSDCATHRCAPGYWCSTIDNTCVPPLGEGADCSAGVCDGDLSCRDNVCRAPGALGDACAVQFGLDDCALGLYCDLTQFTPVCTNRLTAGLVCSSPDQCADGLWCSSGGACTPFADIGQPCSVCAGDALCVTQKCALLGQTGDDCGSSACAYNLYCNAQNKCAPEVPAGTSCS